MNFSKEQLERLKKNFNDHQKPVTRRDFLSLGLMSFSSTLALPSTFIINNTKALLDEVFQDAIKDPAFFVMDLAGGAALFGNFLVGHKGGATDLLNSYSTLGWRPRKNKLDFRFGAPMAGGGVSKILEGILEMSSKEAQDNFRIGTICHAANSDSQSNPLSAFSLVCSSGAKGTHITQALGTRNSISGGQSIDPLNKKTLKPISIQGLSDIENSLGVAGRFNSLNNDSKNHVLKMISKNKDFFKNEIINNAYEEMEKTEIISIDPRRDQELADIYNLSLNSDNNSQKVVFSGIANSVINNISGPGILTIGDCDYHNGNQEDGDEKDLEIGREIGRLLELAHRKKRKMFIQILTDGGMYARESETDVRIWTGDNDDKCMTVMCAYDPDIAPEYRDQNKTQVGYFTQGQGAERSTILGDQTRIAYGVFANYLSFSGRINEFENFAPGVFTKEELEEVLIF